MIYVSTGYVFSGKGRYEHTEDDIPNPANVYGRTKLQGENAVKEALNDYYIFRAEWMIGGGPKRDKKFVAKVIEKCLKDEDIEAVDDMFSTPTFAKDFVNGLKQLINKVPFGTYHLANKGICSRYELATEIVKDLNAKVQVKPVSSDKFPLPAPRAQSTGIKNYRLEKMGIDLMPKWQDSLKEYIIKEWQIK
jgi:dTDP-4-dehydrorhamnose reductase